MNTITKSKWWISKYEWTKRALQCQWCFKFLRSAETLQRHQQNGCVKALGRAKKQLHECADANLGAEANTDHSVCSTEANAESDGPGPSGPILCMRYAWEALRDHVTEVVGTRAASILEQAFRRGTAKGGDRQSCFQMVSSLTTTSTLTHAHPCTPTHTHPPPSGRTPGGPTACGRTGVKVHDTVLAVCQTAKRKGRQ